MQIALLYVSNTLWMVILCNRLSIGVNDKPLREIVSIFVTFDSKTHVLKSTCVFETRTATGRKHFARQGSGVSHIFIFIISNGEKILSNVNVVV